MLHLQEISKQYGSKILFEKADAHLNHRSRVALIGPNGAGKSTLIKLILGHESPDAGRVSRATHMVIGHLAQEVPRFEGRNVLDEVMRLDGRREEILQAKSELEHQFAKAGPDGASTAEPEALERYGRLLEELENLDEYRLESRAKEILDGMGFKPTDLARPLTEFSGGWLMRVALSRILLMEPDLLLLDEPTNHLDLESLLWLEDFLQSFRGALLVVSHDTQFLNRVVESVWEIDQRKLTSYRGNLEAFATQKQERLEILRAQHAGQQAKIAELEGFIKRFGAKATKARQAQSRQKQLDKIERIEIPDDRQTVRFRFPPAPHSGREVVTVRRAQLSYGTKRVFRDLDWTIQRGSRVALVGVNGAGKTSLLKLLSGELRPTAGELKLGHEVRVGYYAQHQADQLNAGNSIVRELEAVAPDMGIAQVRAIAGAFLFSGEAVDKKCGVLSGGEKARVALAKLLLSPSNFLILDEPTNHLDVDSREVLLEALQDFEGTLVLVSHDRSFVGPLVDSVLEIEPTPEGSRVTHLLGSYDDYLARKTREMREARKLAAQAKSAARASGQGISAATSVATAGAAGAGETVFRTKPSNNQVRSWERMRDQLEADIAKTEKRMAEVSTALADTATYNDKEKALKLAEESRKLETTLGDKIAEWEKVCGQLEDV